MATLVAMTALMLQVVLIIPMSCAHVNDSILCGMKYVLISCLSELTSQRKRIFSVLYPEFMKQQCLCNI